MTDLKEMDKIYQDSVTENIARMCRKINLYEVVETCYFDKETKQIKIGFYKDYNDIEKQNIINLFLKGGVLEYDKKIDDKIEKHYDKIEPMGVY